MKKLNIGIFSLNFSKKLTKLFSKTLLTPLSLKAKQITQSFTIFRVIAKLTKVRPNIWEVWTKTTENKCSRTLKLISSVEKKFKKKFNYVFYARRVFFWHYSQLSTLIISGGQDCLIEKKQAKHVVPPPLRWVRTKHSSWSGGSAIIVETLSIKTYTF